MRLTTSFFILSGLISLAFSRAVVQNTDIEGKSVVPNNYIITYKSGSTRTNKKKHEEAITRKAKSKGKGGVINNIDLDGFQGYVAEMTPSELNDVVNSDLVSTSKLRLSDLYSILTPVTRWLLLRRTLFSISLLL
jgi:hypothetical protein